MIFSAHFISAGVVGEQIGNSVLAFLFGIVLHFILDSIPHFDTTDAGKATLRQWLLIMADAFFCLLMLAFMLKPSLSIDSSFYWGALGGIFPDLLDNVPFWNKMFRKTGIGSKIHSFHDWIQPTQAKPIAGLLVQVLIVLIFAFIYLR